MINATSAHGAAIGTGATQFESSGRIVINGGTINASGGSFNWGGAGLTGDGIGGTQTLTGTVNEEKSGVFINGGSVNTNRVENNRPTDGANNLYLATVKLNADSGGTAVTSAAYYDASGSSKNYAINGKTDGSGSIYLWLPEGAIVTSVTTGSANYYGSLLVTEDDLSAATFKSGTKVTLTVDARIENATATFSNGLNTITASEGSTVFVKVVPNEPYAVDGVGTEENPTSYTHVTDNLYSVTMPNDGGTLYVSLAEATVPAELDLAKGPITFGYDSSRLRYVTYTDDNGQQTKTKIPASITYNIIQSNSETATTDNTITISDWNSGGQPLLLTIKDLNINADTVEEGSKILSENLIAINNSTVELTLAGTSTLTSNVATADREVALLGVDGRSELTITQDSNGSLTATAAAGYGAAIGGNGDEGADDGVACGIVNIKGGTIAAVIGNEENQDVGFGAAIGSGRRGTGGTVNISGGKVTATSHGAGAAIGSGTLGTAFAVNISGGKVIASNTYSSTSCGAAIGSGTNASGAIVDISGGDIDATGARAPAIGSGYGSSSTATVNISGGNINIDKDAKASIGAGTNGTATVTIIGGSVNGKITSGVTVTNGTHNVYLITATLPDKNAAVTGSITGGNYNFTGVKTNKEGKIFLWLPEGNASVQIGGDTYGGMVAADSANTLTRLKNLSELSIELESPGSFTYTGSQIQPGVTVKDGGVVVDSSKYTVSYGTNINVGTGTVTVKAESSSTAYNGEATRSFTIVPVKLEVVSVTTKSNSREYNGSPAVEISGIELKGVLNSEDVSVSTESLLGGLPSANAGDYAFVTLPTLTLTGAGKANYTLSPPSGEVKLAQTFTITKAPAPKPSTVTVSRNYAVAKVSVPTGIVAGEGSAVSVGAAIGSGAGKVGDAALDVKGNLTFTLSGGAKDDEIVLPVSILSPNYDGAITTTVTVNLTDKLDQRPLRVKVSDDSSGGTLSLSSSGGSGKGTVSYEIVSGTESISVNGNVLTATGPGTAMVIATKEGTGQYNPARSSALVVTRTEDGKFIVDSNEDSNDAVDNSVAGSGPSASVMSSVVLPVDSSTWGYSSDKLDQRPLTVKATGTTVAAGGTLELSASGGSGRGAVTYEVIKGTGSASVSGSTLTGEASGTVTVIATKTGTSQYNPARSQPLVITIE